MNTIQVNVAVVYHSGYGHTARQAEAVARGVHSVDGATVDIRDVEHLDDSLWTVLQAADAIIFGSPTYFGGHSSKFQEFAEATAPIWAEAGWKDKLAAGFTNSAGINGDKQNTLLGLAVFAAQHGMQWVSLGLPPAGSYRSDGSEDDLNRLGSFLGAMAQSPSDLQADRAPRESDLKTAEHLGRRVAHAAMRQVRGSDIENGVAV